MNRKGYRQYRINSVRVTQDLDTKRHTWQFWIGTHDQSKEPDLEFSKAKGEAIIKFLEVMQNGKG